MTTARPDSQFSDPEKSVVSGLTFEDAVVGLNLHRPGFDFVAYYYDQNGKRLSSKPQVLYEAFQPLYTADEPITQDFGVGKKTVLEPPKGAITTKISCRRVSGESVPLSLGGPIELKLDPHVLNPERQFFKLYLTGHLVIRGREHLSYYIPRWPQVSSGLGIVLNDPPERPPGWWQGPEPPTKYG